MPTLLITRPQDAAERFLAQVKAQLPEVSAIVSPAMKFDSVDVPNPPKAATLILTSAQAVQEAARLGYGCAAVCVGQRTTEMAQAAGMVARFGGQDVQSLIANTRQDRPKGPIVYIRGEHVASDIVTELKPDLKIDEVIAYRQIAAPLSEAAHRVLEGNLPVVLPLFSPRSAWLVQVRVTAPLHVIAMSQRVAEAARHLNVSGIETVPEPTSKAMVAATCHRLRSLSHDPLA